MFIFVFPTFFLSKKHQKKENVVQLRHLSMHVLHIVAELLFGVVEICVLKKEACLHVSLLLWQEVNIKLVKVCTHFLHQKLLWNVVFQEF